jgi:redox-sensitive bicupin YhaK (pirin superfamily)
MISFSKPYLPTHMRRRNVFSARSYPRQAFDNLYDPILNVDWFEMTGPTFPPHPHAGFSAVTYLFEESPNGFINRDSLSGLHDIAPGGLHWTRASGGVMHEETPMPKGGAVQGLQIFVNLPAAHQHDQAGGFPLPAAAMRVSKGEGWTRRLAIDGQDIGAAKNALPSPVRVEEIKLLAGKSMALDVSLGWGGILIMIDGGVQIEDVGNVAKTAAIAFASQEGGTFTVTAGAEGSRFVVLSGAQLHQEVYAHGPLMMASQQSLQKAYDVVSKLRL